METRLHSNKKNISEYIFEEIIKKDQKFDVPELIDGIYDLMKNPEYISKDEKFATEKQFYAEWAIRRIKDEKKNEPMHLKNLKLNGFNKDEKVEDLEKKILKKQLELKYRISLSAIKSVVLEIRLKLLENNGSELNVYKNFESFSASLDGLFTLTNVEKNEFKGKVRENIFLTSNNMTTLYEEIVEIMEGVDFDKLSPQVPQKLLPYYLFTISGDQTFEMPLSVKNFLSKSIDIGRNKYVYAYDKIKNIKDGRIKDILNEVYLKFGDELFRYYKPQMKIDLYKYDQSYRNEPLKLKRKILDYLELKKNTQEISIKEFASLKKILNFDKDFYYYSSIFMRFFYFNEILKNSVKFTSISVSDNIFTLNKIEFLYDALLLTQSLKKDPDIDYDPEILKKICAVDDVFYKRMLINLYPEFDTDRVKKIANCIIKLQNNIKDEIINGIVEVNSISIEKFYKDSKLMNEALIELNEVIFDLEEIEEIKVISNMYVDLRIEEFIEDWYELNYYEKMLYIEEYTNNLLLLIRG